MEDKECACLGKCPLLLKMENMMFRFMDRKMKEIEEAKKQRWRAKEGERYYFVGSAFGISSHKEEFDSTDNGFWNSGNYFSTEKEAQKYADEFRRMLQERTLDKEE